jgi:hypothetical protein
MTDTINPSHYQNDKWHAIDVIEDVVEAVVKATGNAKAANNIGSSLKYLLRAGKKGDTKEEAMKAEWHIRRAINHLAPRDSLPMAENVHPECTNTAIGKADVVVRN